MKQFSFECIDWCLVLSNNNRKNLIYWEVKDGKWNRWREMASWIYDDEFGRNIFIIFHSCFLVNMLLASSKTKVIGFIYLITVDILGFISFLCFFKIFIFKFILSIITWDNGTMLMDSGVNKKLFSTSKF